MTFVASPFLLCCVLCVVCCVLCVYVYVYVCVCVCVVCFVRSPFRRTALRGTTQNFALFVFLWGGLLVEFWWRLKSRCESSVHVWSFRVVV